MVTRWYGIVILESGIASTVQIKIKKEMTLIDDLKKATITLEANIVECDRIIEKLTNLREEIVSDIDKYLFVIKKQKVRFDGDLHAIHRAESVISDEKKKKVWRENVLMRDRFCCRRCGSDMDITLHHIVPKSVCSPDQLWNEMNGISLCQRCHNEWHASNGNNISIMKFYRWLRDKT